jgi:type II secretory pathway component PulF
MAINLQTTKTVTQSTTFKRESTVFPFFRKKVSVRDRMFFTERLALLLETGGALQPSLQALREQMDNPLLAGIIGSLADDVSAGRSFSQALAKHPEMFSSTYINLIRASEQGGFMDKVLKQLLSMDEKQEKFRVMIRTALAYPSFLVFFSIAVISFILLVVFPKFGPLFDSIRDQLPMSTTFLLAISTGLQRYWYTLAGALLVTTVVVNNWLRSPTGHETIDHLKLRLPIIRDIFIQIYLTQSLRVMGLSLANGVSVIDSLASCRDVVNNFLFRRFMTKAIKSVTDGKGLANCFEKEIFIPAMVRQMIKTGEESGNLALVMERVADFYERELENKLAFVTKIIEPLLLLVMGLVVGLIVSSLILPIFKLSRAVH